MSCGSKLKKEIRKTEGNAGLMEAWSYAQYAGETERETEKKQKNSISENSNSMFCQYKCVCSINAHVLYKSLQGLTEVLSYFNALKERLHKPQKYIPYGISFFASPRHPVLCAEPAYSIGLNRLGTRPNRSVQTDSVLGFFSRSGRC